MNWANDRLKAVDFSSNKQATFTVKDASVTEEIIKSEKLTAEEKAKFLGLNAAKFYGFEEKENLPYISHMAE